MGLPPRKPADARHRAVACRRPHPGAARPRRKPAAGTRLGALIAALLWLSLPVAAETIRVATFAAPLSRDGPGLLLRDIARGEDAQIAAIAGVIERAAPDILLLTDFDWDHEGAALTAFADTLGFPHRFALRPNAGLATGLDLDGDGRTGDARDAMGYGRFSGDGGLAILSRWPVDTGAVRDLSTLLWRDLPGAMLPVRDDGTPFPSDAAQAAQRLSSTGHWIVPVLAPDGPLTLMVWSATPPVFDGPEDANGLRAADEARLWQVLLDGGVGPVPDAPFVLMGNANLDPADGEGPRDAIRALLSDPRLRDPRPQGAGAAAVADPGQTGDPALDTADWPDDGPGNLRVTYVLPSADLTVTAAGTFWPAPDDADAALLGDDGLAAGPHRLVWADIAR